MKFKSPVYSQASGSIAGVTYSHNRGGMYTRARAIPTNPGSTFQTAVRALMAQMSNIWVNFLTVAQRDAWDTYALNVPIPDSLGEPRNIGGLGQYQRSNIPRLQAGLLRIDTAPVIFDLGDLTLPTIISVTAATDIASVGYDNTDDWAIAVGGALIVLASRPQNPSINYFTGPYRFAGTVLGAVVPPTTPDPITIPFGVAVGQKVFFQFRAAFADGRLTGRFHGRGTAV